MGLILDSSLLIADERVVFDRAGILRQFSDFQSVIAAITTSELLHGVERAQNAARKTLRQRHVEQILAVVSIQPFAGIAPPPSSRGLPTVQAAVANPPLWGILMNVNRWAERLIRGKDNVWV